MIESVLASLGPMDPWVFGFLYAFLLVGAMEWGDGTMILANGLLMEHRAEGRARHVVYGVVVGSVIAPALGIGFVILIGDQVSHVWIHLISGVLFAFLGTVAARGQYAEARGVPDEEEDGWWSRKIHLFASLVATGTFAVFTKTTILFTGLESIDRTEITTINLGFQGLAWSANWSGSALGLMVSNLISFAVIWKFGSFIPKKWFGYAAAILFYCGAGYMFFLVLEETFPG